MLIEFADAGPIVSADAWIAPGVVLSGSVTIESKANVWFGVVARGNIEPIKIGEASNIQDGVILHTDEGFPLSIAEYVAVGHGAVVHGATVERHALIGMRATVLTGARIGTGAVIGAGSVVLEHQQIPPCVLAVGVPARVVRAIEPGAGRATCLRYLERVERYRQASETY